MSHIKEVHIQYRAVGKDIQKILLLLTVAIEREPFFIQCGFPCGEEDGENIVHHVPLLHGRQVLLQIKFLVVMLQIRLVSRTVITLIITPSSEGKVEGIQLSGSVEIGLLVVKAV